MFFKKKITFTCEIPGVEKTMPVIPMMQQAFEWRKIAAQEYGDKRHSLNNKSIARCPGIAGMLTTGWVVRAWQDIRIETNGDGVNFKWRTPIDQKQLCKFDYIDVHRKEALSSMSGNWPASTLQNIIKINTGWWTEVPKNHILLQLPVPYNDVTAFSAVPGVYSSELRVAELTVPVLWHALNSVEVIKAGTPLAQLILVPEHEYEMNVTGSKVSNIRDIYHQLISSSFSINYKRISEIMSKLIK